MIRPLTYAVSTELQKGINEHDCLHALGFLCEVDVAFDVYKFRHNIFAVKNVH
jgi:hypothetical protein